MTAIKVFTVAYIPQALDQTYLQHFYREEEVSNVHLIFRDGFNWKLATWSRRSYCSGALPEMPLMLFRQDGACVAFCGVR